MIYKPSKKQIEFHEDDRPRIFITSVNPRNWISDRFINMPIVKVIQVQDDTTLEIQWRNTNGEILVERRTCPPLETWKVRINEIKRSE